MECLEISPRLTFSCCHFGVRPCRIWILKSAICKGCRPPYQQSDEEKIAVNEHDTKPAAPEMLEPVPERILLFQRLHNTMQNEAKFPWSSHWQTLKNIYAKLAALAPSLIPIFCQKLQEHMPVFFHRMITTTQQGGQITPLASRFIQFGKQFLNNCHMKVHTLGGVRRQATKWVSPYTPYEHFSPYNFHAYQNAKLFGPFLRHK
jgi:hypothetical protein